MVAGRFLERDEFNAHSQIGDVGYGGVVEDSLSRLAVGMGYCWVGEAGNLRICVDMHGAAEKECTRKGRGGEMHAQRERGRKRVEQPRSSSNNGLHQRMAATTTTTSTTITTTATTSTTTTQTITTTPPRITHHYLHHHQHHPHLPPTNTPRTSRFLNWTSRTRVQ